MSVSAIVYVPRTRLKSLSTYDVCALLQYDGISYRIFVENGIPEYAKYIDADVVSRAMFSIIENLPTSIDDFLNYYAGDFNDPKRAALSELFSSAKQLRYLASLYVVLRDISAIVLPDTTTPREALPDSYPISPFEFVDFRAWLEDRIKGE